MLYNTAQLVIRKPQNDHFSYSINSVISIPAYEHFLIFTKFSLIKGNKRENVCITGGLMCTDTATLKIKLSFCPTPLISATRFKRSPQFHRLR